MRIMSHVADLGFTNFGHRVAEIVIGGDAENLDTRTVGNGAQLAASTRRPVERASMRPLTVDLEPVVSVAPGPVDTFGQRKRFSAIPEPQVGDGVEPEFHFAFLSRCQDS
jgi:hypothetical protein